MMQLRTIGNYILPARSGIVRGCEIKPIDRYAALIAAGERPEVAAAVVAGLVYQRKGQPGGNHV